MNTNQLTKPKHTCESVDPFRLVCCWTTRCPPGDLSGPRPSAGLPQTLARPLDCGPTIMLLLVFAEKRGLKLELEASHRISRQSPVLSG